jgi:hypothetical protein
MGSGHAWSHGIWCCSRQTRAHGIWKHRGNGNWQTLVSVRDVVFRAHTGALKQICYLTTGCFRSCQQPVFGPSDRDRLVQVGGTRAHMQPLCPLPFVQPGRGPYLSLMRSTEGAAPPAPRPAQARGCSRPAARAAVPAGCRPHERVQQLMDPTTICGQFIICSEICE